MTILGIAGSLRKGSFNSSLLRAAVELAPGDVAVSLCELSSIPLYNGDVEADSLPQSVVELREQIRQADAILIATPEYNYSIPGVLKNSVDWASRPPDQPFDGKPVGIMGASAGLYGTVRAQNHLRQVFQCLNAFVMPKPEMMVARAQEKFDAEGRLIDEKTREQLGRFVKAMVEWVGRFR